MPPDLDEHSYSGHTLCDRRAQVLAAAGYSVGEGELPAGLDVHS